MGVAARSDAALADLEEHQLVRALAASQAEAKKAGANLGPARNSDELMAAALKVRRRNESKQFTKYYLERFVIFG